jgi:hypothetical protein
MEESNMSAVTTPIDMAITLFAVAISVGHLSMMFFGDSFFSSFGERWFVGATVGYTFFVVWNSYKSNAIDFIAQGRWWLIIPVIIGLLSFTRLTKYRWAARYPVAALSGIGLGVFFGFNLRGSILAIITSTVDELITLQPDPFSAIISFIAVVSVVTYYLYSERYATIFHSRSGRLYYVMRLGRLFMMASFGYLLGYVGVAFGLGILTSFFTVVIKRPIETFLAFIAGG